MNSRGTGDDTRPDGRTSSPETLRLRAATRALRLHLDELPIPFHFNGPGDQFFAELTFPFARQRYACAESLIGAGFAGTVIGSLARSLLVDGLRWQWIGAAPDERLPSLLGSMMDERSRMCLLLERSDTSCPILSRWFAPVTEITNLTGALQTWLQAPSMPDGQELLERFLAEPLMPSTAMPSMNSIKAAELLMSARRLVAITGLQGAIAVLAHAGHGNLLGIQSSVTRDGITGHDLRPDHEALFMQVAAVGVTLTLLGVCVAVPESWPREVEERSFLNKAFSLTEEIVSAATKIHGLGQLKRRTGSANKQGGSQSRKSVLFHPGAILDSNELYPDVNTAENVIAKAKEFDVIATSWRINPWTQVSRNLPTILTYMGAHSSLEAVMTTQDDPGGAIIGVFAARMLLEEAARFHWVTCSSSEQVVLERSKIYLDEYRARRKKTINEFSSNGVGRRNAEKLLSLPENIVVPADQLNVRPGRQQLPPIAELLRNMGQFYPETGWIEVAYSLLSQVTHSTPIGLVHSIRVKNGEIKAATISVEMLGLTLDAACLGSSHLLGMSSVILTGGSREAASYAIELRRQAYAVHNAARLVHGLD